MRIKEVADKLGITPRAIRFYEQRGLVAPDKEAHNRYRDYADEDVWRLQTVIALREIGMPVEDVRRALDEIDRGDGEHLRYYLELQQAVMYAQWVELKRMIDTTERMIASADGARAPDREMIYALADGSRRLREARRNWYDRWNYDRQAPIHDSLVYGEHPDYPIYDRYEEALGLAFDWVQAAPGERGLDVGCGTGNLAGMFLSAGVRMSGIDQSREMLRRCRDKSPRLETKLGNFLAIPHADGTFDFAATSFAFHHLAGEQQLLALEEMRRVLKPRGRICIVDAMVPEEADGEWEAARRLRGTGSERHYARVSDMLRWFDENGYVTKHRRIGAMVHIVLAVPIR
ncbi:MerR family transcriptional regulator [Paenibacillus flagellatus]|uniref:Transcriptional regulator n=1 Tax=Paenibacillus flagellatus TaxID=2211139 RepID=A0A2V5K5E9_9BACL|nr:MerR family transcriptional regulator [Paenibacillus flagellatus]PYI53972.1 transcriptional regulator [Paenibacillus flagellatus]